MIGMGVERRFRTFLAEYLSASERTSVLQRSNVAAGILWAVGMALWDIFQIVRGLSSPRIPREQ